jgi:DEAD/DEAH box helicase domain-containing protein
VIDEIHSYRGVFGSHLANVLRRLKRMCAFYGSRGRSSSCARRRSATRKQHAEALIEDTGDGASPKAARPAAIKHVLLWNPPVVNPDLGLRASARSQSNRIARWRSRPG